MTDLEPDFQYLNLCLQYEPDSHDELVSMVEHLTGLNPPEDFANQTVNVDIDEVSETEITFSTDAPPYPQDYNQSSFLTSVSEEDRFVHNHIYSEPEYLDNLLDLLEYVLETFGPTVPTTLSIIHSIEAPVDELGIGTSPDGTRLSGVRFYIDNDEYIFGEWNEVTSVRCALDEGEALRPEELRSEIEERIDRTKNQVMEVIDGT